MAHKHYATAIEDKIPMSQKIVFGFGMLGNQMFPAALGIFMVILVQGLGMNTILYGILFFVPRLFDAITDPVMGFISDNTKTRWGRRRPYVFIGAIIAGISFIAMWQIYPENSEIYNFTYFLILSIVFYLGMTIFGAPYVAMGYEMSNDFHERTRLMAVSQWIGQWAWVIVPWFWVILYNQNYFPDAPAGARTLSIWVGLSCMALCLIPAIFGKTGPVPEKLEVMSRENLKSNFTSLLKGLVETLKNAPFRRLCGATFLVFNAFNTVAAFSFFIIVHYMFGGKTGPEGSWIWPTLFGMSSALCTCFLVIPIITFLSQKFGKKNTFLISQGISILGYIGFYFAFQPGKPWLMFLPLPLFAFGIGGLFTLMMSMTADVCDLDELNTGSRREGTFGAVYWWMVKFGFAVAGLMTGVIFWLVGFDSGAAEQTPEALRGLLSAYVFVPMAGTILAMFVMRNYDLSEEKAHEIRLELEKRRGTKAIGR